jgi:hypothetical protein
VSAQRSADHIGTIRTSPVPASPVHEPRPAWLRYLQQLGWRLTIADLFTNGCLLATLIDAPGGDAVLEVNTLEHVFGERSAAIRRMARDDAAAAAMATTIAQTHGTQAALVLFGGDGPVDGSGWTVHGACALPDDDKVCRWELPSAANDAVARWSTAAAIGLLEARLRTAAVRRSTIRS